MHEIGVVRSMVKTVTDFAQANGIAEVTEIVLDIGELSLVIPKYVEDIYPCLLYTSPSPRDSTSSRMPSSA